MGFEDLKKIDEKLLFFILKFILIFRLVVHYGAFITHSTGAVFADIGEHVVLECQADAFPRRVGIVKWTKGTF